MMRVILKNTFYVLVVFILFSSHAQAAVHLSLGGSHSKANAGYQKIESGAGSGGVAVDLGSYFRVGYSHRQELATKTGYEYKEATANYVYFESLSHVISNSVDLTLILYAGEIFTPFIFSGVTVKRYISHMKMSDGTEEHIDVSLPGPEGGAGMSIRLNQKFSLKITYTMSQGITQVPGKQQEPTVDSYTQVGISYSL